MPGEKIPQVAQPTALYHVGQFPAEEIMKEYNPHLKERLLAHAELIAGEKVPLEELFDKTKLKNFGLGKKFLWNEEELMRLVFLYLEGRTNSEIAHLFTVRQRRKEPLSSELIQTQINQFLSTKANQLGRRSSLLRKQNEFLHPQGHMLEMQLSTLEKEFNVSRETMFEMFPRTEPKGRNYIRDTVSVYSPHIFIQLAFQHFILHWDSTKLAESASQLIGKEVSPRKFGDYFFRMLSAEARPKFELRENKHWTKEEYMRIANMFIENDIITQSEIADTFNVSRDSLSGAMRQHGKNLLKRKPEYKDQHWLFAFLLEYGTFPEGVDPTARARDISRTFTDVSSKATRDNLDRTKRNSQESDS